ncbi:hypothetical protein PJN38_24100 [Mycobacterium kansasii]
MQNIIGTPKQHSYITRLARDRGYQSAYYAAAKYTDNSISRIQRKGLPARDASAVIEGLLAEDATR